MQLPPISTLSFLCLQSVLSVTRLNFKIRDVAVTLEHAHRDGRGSTGLCWRLCSGMLLLLLLHTDTSNYISIPVISS